MAPAPEPLPPNYIADQNRFGLETPPRWWLQGLYDFDSELVVIPSRTEPLLRLCRRTTNTPGLQHAAVLDRHADTAMMVSHKVVPVTSITVRNRAWDLVGVVQTLKARDIWEAGGAEKAADMLDRRDSDERAQVRERLRDDLGARARDAYRSMMARIGARNKRASDYHGAARTPGAAATALLIPESVPSPSSTVASSSPVAP